MIFRSPLPDVEIRAGDRLRISDTPIRLKRAEAALHCTRGLRTLKANLGPDDPYFGEMSKKCSAIAL